jgi:hypothetical protein
MYKIAIPSGNRHKSKYFKTIRLLRKINFRMKDVFLFLDTSEIQSYTNNNFLEDINIIPCQNKNIVQVRNFIEKDYFDNDTHILCLDDDINYLSYKDTLNQIKKITTVDILDKIVKQAFQLCLDNNCRLWGAYPIARNNKWFSETKTFIGNNHIVAACSGVIINKLVKKQDPLFQCKEEYERGFLYGKNIRLGFLAMDTKYYTQDGIGQRSSENQLKTCQLLIKTYPNRYSKTPLKINKLKGNVDLRLKRNYFI